MLLLKPHKVPTMSLYEKMLNIANEVVKETQDRTTPLLHAHLNDIHQSDKDVVLNDMQAGDHWMWIIKGNGCGTYLFLLDGQGDFGYKRSISDQNAIIYLVRVTAENQGEVSRVPNNEALGYTERKMVTDGRIPRRLTMFQQLSDLMRLDKVGVRLSETKIWCDFSVVHGDLSTLTISNNGGTLSITIERKVINLPEGVLSRQSMLYTTIKLGANYDPCEEYDAVYEIEATDAYHAI